MPLKARVELHGGPLDGFEGWRNIQDQPGKFPLLVETIGKSRFVYQARAFADDHGDGPLVMDFVQILGKRDDV